MDDNDKEIAGDKYHTKAEQQRTPKTARRSLSPGFHTQFESSPHEDYIHSKQIHYEDEDVVLDTLLKDTREPRQHGGDDSACAHPSSERNPSDQVNLSSQTRIFAQTSQRTPQAVSRHTIKTRDRDEEEYLPTRHDPYGEEKIDRLGVLKGGRTYACKVFRISPSRPGRLFMSAAHCARHLGYTSVLSMLQTNVSLFVFPARDGRKLPPGDIERHGVVSAWSVFRQFGHRVIVRGRPVFDDYFEIHAKEMGHRDHTIWAAAQGLISTTESLVAITKASDSDLNEEDSTGRTPVQYMQERLEKTTQDNRILYHDEISQAFWTRALALKSSHEVDEALRKVIINSLAGAEAGAARLSASHLKTLTSVVDFCSAAKALKPDVPLFDNSHNGPALKAVKLGPHVMVFQWEVPAVIEALLGESGTSSVADVISHFTAIYGSETNYECASCSEILYKYWDSSGRLSIEIISRVMAELLESEEPNSVHGTMEEADGVKDVHYAATRSTLALAVGAREQKSVKEGVTYPLFEALGWVCAAIRRSPKHPVVAKDSESQLYVSRKLQTMLLSRESQKDTTNMKSFWEGSTFMFLALDPYRAATATQLSSNCWTKFFSSTPVVEAIIKRPWGSGVKISFDLMVRLSAVQNYCSLDGATFLLGYYTALIPTEVNEKRDSIQWHFECLESKEKILLPEKLDLRARQWARITRDEVDRMTCFVGWYDEAHIMLGTEELNEGHNGMRRSRGLRAKEKELRSDGEEVGMQIGTVEPLSVVFKAAHQLKWVNLETRFDPSNDYHSALVDQKGKAGLMIDNGTKQAWLLPLLSVMLYLCHCYYQANLSNDQVYRIPFAKPKANGDEAVMEAIRKIGERNIEPDDDCQPYLFRQLFHKLLLRLMAIDLPKSKNSCIFATELTAILRADKKTSPREIATQGKGYSWIDLVPFANIVETVAVCDNMGPAIKPETLQRCGCQYSCQQVPKMRGYLTAPITVLNGLAGRGKGTFEPENIIINGKTEITSGTWWEPQCDPWQWNGNPSLQCSGIWEHRSLTAAVLQRTRHRTNIEPIDALTAKWKGLKDKRAEKPIKQLPPEGAVIFGRLDEEGERHIPTNELRRFLGMTTT